MDDKCYARLSPRHLGMAGGLIWGFGIFFVTLMALGMPGYGKAFLESINSVYPGTSVSFSGGILGLIWGTVDGFIGFFLIAWLYNWMISICPFLNRDKDKK